MACPTYDETLEFIKVAHFGQTDAAGNPYWEHPRAVAQIVRFFHIADGYFEGVDPEHEVLAGLLHDVIEDTPFGAEALIEMGYPFEVVNMVQLVSKGPNDKDYFKFIQRIIDSGNLGAMRVKLSDNKHNMHPFRIDQLPRAKRGVRKKYLKSAEMLARGIKERLE